jgi:hypothetical protein
MRQKTKAERIVKNWDRDDIIERKECKRDPIRWSVKFGFNFLLLSWIAVATLFVKAFLSPAKAVVIQINNYSEMYIEIVLLVVSAIFIYKFISECVAKGILRFRWQR